MFTVKSQLYPYQHNGSTFHKRDTIGTFKHAEDAAQCIANNVQGSIVMAGRNTVWREGYESQSAGESFDHAAEIMYKRVDAFAVIAAIPTGR